MTIPKCADCGNEANVSIGNAYLCSWCVIQRLDRIPQTVAEDKGFPCSCHIQELEGAGQHSPSCDVFKVG